MYGRKRAVGKKLALDCFVVRFYFVSPAVVRTGHVRSCSRAACSMKACAPVPLPERWCRANSPMKAAEPQCNERRLTPTRTNPIGSVPVPPAEARLLNGQSFRYTARLFKLGITIGGRQDLAASSTSSFIIGAGGRAGPGRV